MDRICRSLALVLATMTLGSVIYAAPAAADLIGTPEVVSTLQTGNERERIKALVGRQELAKQLQVFGITPEYAQTRVDALTDQEVHALAARLDSLPAGGNFSEFQWIVIIIGIVIIALLL